MLRRCLLLPFLAVLALSATAATAAAQSPAANAAQADGLLNKTLYKTGASGRFLMGGQWYFRADPSGNGGVSEFAANPSTAGWTPVSVPNAWNAKDYSDASFAGGVGWYRKSFHLPSAAKALSWVVRFESVNYRARIYLNGKLIGKNTGAYLPFEIRLPAGDLKRGGSNLLAIRVDDRRFPTDFPPSGLSTTGVPTGGWWNYGGLLREVYLRKIDSIDFNTVSVLPDLPCGSCDAHVTYKATPRRCA
jgi:beta-glucuronidase